LGIYLIKNELVVKVEANTIIDVDAQVYFSHLQRNQKGGKSCSVTVGRKAWNLRMPTVVVASKSIELDIILDEVVGWSSSIISIGPVTGIDT
jgi:hypothetical protein